MIWARLQCSKKLLSMYVVNAFKLPIVCNWNIKNKKNSLVIVSFFSIRNRQLEGCKSHSKQEVLNRFFFWLILIRTIIVHIHHWKHVQMTKYALKYCDTSKKLQTTQSYVSKIVCKSFRLLWNQFIAYFETNLMSEKN